MQQIKEHVDCNNVIQRHARKKRRRVARNNVTKYGQKKRAERKCDATKIRRVTGDELISLVKYSIFSDSFQRCIVE